MVSSKAKSAPKTFSARVIEWQRVHGRHGLPWQGTRDAYRIWLSEIMLQQTQVSTVLDYYGRFLQRFPDVAALAAAPVDDVMAAWSGLGYYSRARNLHRCAQTVVEVHGGVFPRSAEILQTLPGIGRSTAAAIAAFSAGERVAILDGNVKRVLTRVLAFDQDVARPQALRELWDHAERLLPEQDVQAYTQGLMDLGATVCTSRKPQCLLCPVQGQCEALKQSRVQDFPLKTRRMSRSQRASTLWLAYRPGSASRAPEILLQRRPGTGVWAGLWSLPEWDSAQALRSAVRPLKGLGAPLQEWPPRLHVLTHVDWMLHPVLHRISVRASKATLEQACSLRPDTRWWGLDEALALGLPAPVRVMLQELAQLD